METIFGFDVSQIGWPVEVLGVAVLSLFLPLTAASYCKYRLPIKKKDVHRTIEMLGLGKHLDEFYKSVRGHLFVSSVIWATVISFFGIFGLLMGIELKIAKIPNLILGGSYILSNDIEPHEIEKYQQIALLVFGMAFIGAYLWGAKTILRRFMTFDLLPGVYFSFGLRLVFSSIVALVLFHGFQLLAKEPVPNNVWPLIGFLVGMFPGRVIQMMSERFGVIFSYLRGTASSNLPLELVEGVTPQDKVRLAEIGVDNCHGLAEADFVGLMIRTPYNAQKLVDWMLQAQLCLYFGERVVALRATGIRTMSEFDYLMAEKGDTLVQETEITRGHLEQVQRVLRHDNGYKRLKEIEKILYKEDIKILRTKKTTDSEESEKHAA